MAIDLQLLVISTLAFIMEYAECKTIAVMTSCLFYSFRNLYAFKVLKSDMKTLRLER